MPIEEPEQLEALDDDELTAISTTPSDRTGARISIPPPIPKQALEHRSLPPERRSGPPPLPTSSSAPPPSRVSTSPGTLKPPPPLGAHASSSLPPPRTTAAPGTNAPATSSVTPSSGIYRISDAAAEVEKFKLAARDLELKVRLRDDLILELKRTLEEQRKLTASAERERDLEREKLARAQQEHEAALSELAAAQTRQAEEAQRTRESALDDLKQIRGIGPSFERKLHALGITSFSQIAAWTDADIARMSDSLAILPQRITRDGWIESAKAKL